MKTPLSSIGFVLAASFIGSFGAAFLKGGAEKLELNFASLMTNWRIITGVGLFLFSSIFFVLGIREGEITLLYPMAALSYPWAILWSRLFFGEPITRNKIIGLVLILSGIALLAFGNRV